MNNPDDDELLLFHLGEELGPERMDAIACAIAADPRLAARYAALRHEATAWAQRYDDAALEHNVLRFLGQAFDLDGV